MKFNSDVEAKLYALKITTIHVNEEKLLKSIKDYARYQELYMDDPEEKKFWKKREIDAREYLRSATFQQGKFHTGIDELILDIIEFRALIYSFSIVKLKNNPFEKYTFHQQWLIGITYKIYASYGKLLSAHKDDNSLKNLWNDVSSYIAKTKLSNEKEVTDLTNFIMSITNNTSNAMKYRNKTIAHNEENPRIKWDDFDKEFMALCRIWNLIIRWCSSGIIAPFANDQVAFSGLEPFLSYDELSKLKEARSYYINQVNRWCRDEFSSQNGMFEKTR